MAQIEVRRDNTKYDGTPYICRDVRAGKAEIDYPRQELWDGWKIRILLPPTWTNPQDIPAKMKCGHCNWTALERLLQGYGFTGPEGLAIWSWHNGEPNPADWPMFVTSQDFLDRHRAQILEREPGLIDKLAGA